MGMDMGTSFHNGNVVNMSRSQDFLFSDHLGLSERILQNLMVHDNLSYCFFTVSKWAFWGIPF
jgi:hypothetical protein